MLERGGRGQRAQQHLDGDEVVQDADAVGDRLASAVRQRILQIRLCLLLCTIIQLIFFHFCSSLYNQIVCCYGCCTVKDSHNPCEDTFSRYTKQYLAEAVFAPSSPAADDHVHNR